MGWLFSTAWPTKKDLIRERVSTHSWTTEEGRLVTIETVRHACTGNNLWKVQRRTVDGVEAERYIALDLLRNGGFGHGWGYKDLDESCGVYQVSCPLSYLDGLDEPINEYAREWRESVRKYHADRARRREMAKALEPGDVVTIYGKEYTVGMVMPRGKLWVRSKEDGQLYQARAKQLTLKED